MYEIAKQFDFCYGHRVWSQELKEGFSTDLSCACRHLHGHQGTLIIYLSAETLEQGMVTDFKHLGWFKKWLDETLDHKFIMDIHDPLLSHEIPHYANARSVFEGVSLEWMPEGHAVLRGYEKLNPAIQEKYEGLAIVDFVPTSENLCKWIYEIVQERMSQIGVNVSRVQFFETPKSQSNYLPKS